MTLLEAALEYAAKGWPVLPVDQSKRPLTEHGVKDASMDPDQLTRWFLGTELWGPQNKRQGIAIATGTPSEIDVVDLDFKDPLDTWPHTRIIETPRGFHLYYSLGAQGNRIKIPFPGGYVDIRSTGGYVVAPPTPGYRVVSEGPITAWPAHHFHFHEPVDAPTFGPGIPEGQRDDALYRYACWLQGRGYSDADVERFVLHRNTTYRPPLSDHEAKQKIAQALKLPKGPRAAEISLDPITIRTVPLLDVKDEKLEWAIEPWVLAGCVTSLEGDGGVGKSLLAMHWCATLSRRGQRCLYASAEEVASTMLRPRAIASGVDPQFVSFVQKQDTFQLPDALDALEQTVIEGCFKFVVLDPLTSFFAPTSDMNNPQACRQIAEGLNNLAERTKCTVLAIRHWNKNVDSPLATRAMGSKDLGHLVRSQLGVIRHPEQRTSLLLFGVKTNFAEPTTAAMDLGPHESGGWHCFNPRPDAYWTRDRIEHHVQNPNKRYNPANS